MNLPFASPADAGRTVPGTPDPLLGALAKVQSIERVGRVAEAHGTLIRATGLKAAIDELCVLRNPPGEGDPNFRLSAEVVRSEEHTSELQSLMRISYAVFCLKKKIANEHDTKKHTK